MCLEHPVRCSGCWKWLCVCGGGFVVVISRSVHVLVVQVQVVQS